MGLGSHPRTFATDKEGLPVKGFFFGQSSFCEMTIVSEMSVVNVSGYVQTDDDLKLLSPLGCGLQTGAGAIMKLQDLNEDDSIAIFGLGAVGLASVAVCSRTKRALAFLYKLTSSKGFENSKNQNCYRHRQSAKPA